MTDTSSVDIDEKTARGVSKQLGKAHLARMMLLNEMVRAGIIVSDVADDAKQRIDAAFNNNMMNGDDHPPVFSKDAFSDALGIASSDDTTKDVADLIDDTTDAVDLGDDETITLT